MAEQEKDANERANQMIRQFLAEMGWGGSGGWNPLEMTHQFRSAEALLELVTRRMVLHGLRAHSSRMVGQDRAWYVFIPRKPAPPPEQVLQIWVKGASGMFEGVGWKWAGGHHEPTGDLEWPLVWDPVQRLWLGPHGDQPEPALLQVVLALLAAPPSGAR